MSDKESVNFNKFITSKNYYMEALKYAPIDPLIKFAEQTIPNIHEIIKEGIEEMAQEAVKNNYIQTEYDISKITKKIINFEFQKLNQAPSFQQTFDAFENYIDPDTLLLLHKKGSQLYRSWDWNNVNADKPFLFSEEYEKLWVSCPKTKIRKSDPSKSHLPNIVFLSCSSEYSLCPKLRERIDDLYDGITCALNEVTSFNIETIYFEESARYLVELSEYGGRKADSFLFIIFESIDGIRNFDSVIDFLEDNIDTSKFDKNWRYNYKIILSNEKTTKNGKEDIKGYFNGINNLFLAAGLKSIGKHVQIVTADDIKLLKRQISFFIENEHLQNKTILFGAHGSSQFPLISGAQVALDKTKIVREKVNRKESILYIGYNLKNRVVTDFLKVAALLDYNFDEYNDAFKHHWNIISENSNEPLKEELIETYEHSA